MNYWTKQLLYENVDALISQLDFTNKDYPLDSISIAKRYCVDLHLEEIKFNNLCGVLYRGTSTYIALNASHNDEMKNFDCMHELIHYFLHDGEKEFKCLNANEKKAYQNSFLEWQANEGAAQALVPYKLFVPMYVELCLKYRDDILQYNTTKILAKHFNVSGFVISNRINSLRYEIYQYFIKNCNIDNLVILSNRQLAKKKLDKLQAEKNYCVKCYSVIQLESNFCCTCGQKLGIFKSTKGLGYMHYTGIETDSNNKAIACPRCSNEDVGDGDFCPTCGLYLKNHCPKCSKELSGKFRYCPTCGCESTFKPFMLEWKEEQQHIEETQSPKAEAEIEAQNTPSFSIPSSDDDDLPF